MKALDLLIYVIPMITLVLVLVVFMNLKMQALGRKYQDYRSDEFRQSIEQQIAELSKELSVNTDRFNSINHLLVDAQNSYFKKGYETANAWSGESKIDFFKSIGVKLADSVDDTLAFVLTPFNDKYEDQYIAIKSVAIELGFKCTRGDDSIVSTNILTHIIEQLSRARIVIANISGRNPNVFYELGIAHALGKSVLIVSESLADIPFDVNSSRILAFDNEKDLSKKLRNWFVHTLARTPNNQVNEDASR